MTERRRVLKFLAGAAGATAACAAGIPTVGLVLAPLATGASDAGGWTRLLRLDALTVGQVHKVNVVGSETDAWTVAGGRRLGAVFLMRDASDGVKAVSNVCPHLGCGVDIEGNHLTCPCHDSDFSFEGHRMTGPSPRDLDPIDVRVEDGIVAVRFQRFQLGVPERIPLA